MCFAAADTNFASVVSLVIKLDLLLGVSVTGAPGVKAKHHSHIQVS
jgi:hypothetical protein